MVIVFYVDIKQVEISWVSLTPMKEHSIAANETMSQALEDMRIEHNEALENMKEINNYCHLWCFSPFYSQSLIFF